MKHILKINEEMTKKVEADERRNAIKQGLNTEEFLMGNKIYTALMASLGTCPYRQMVTQGRFVKILRYVVAEMADGIDLLEIVAKCAEDGDETKVILPSGEMLTLGRPNE